MIKTEYKDFAEYMNEKHPGFIVKTESIYDGKTEEEIEEMQKEELEYWDKAYEENRAFWFQNAQVWSEIKDTLLG